MKKNISIRKRSYLKGLGRTGYFSPGGRDGWRSALDQVSNLIRYNYYFRGLKKCFRFLFIFEPKKGRYRSDFINLFRTSFITHRKPDVKLESQK